jgi:hypothetical protein
MRDQLAEMTGGTWVQKGGLSNVVADMLRWGDGARAIVGGWSRAGIGHYFNVINDDGQIVFLDGQTGSAGHVARWRNYWVMRTN